MKKTLVLFLMLTCVAAGTARGDEKVKPYVNVGLSSFTIQGGQAGGLVYSSASTGGIIVSAGLRYGIVGAELRGFSTGDFQWNGTVSGFPATLKLNASGAGLFLRAQYMGDNYEIYGLLGKVSANATATLTVIGVGSATVSGPVTSGAAYGIGFSYGLKKWGIGLEWMRYFQDLSATSLTAFYNF